MKERKVLVGITGGIAAYKSAQLVRLLKKAGAQVRVVMTEGGAAFISPLTLQALSGNPVHQTLLDSDAEAGMGHIELAKWADLIIIAPASADFIARFAHGLANDLLSTLCLATEAPIALAPAMNQAMWHNPRTQRNMHSLASDIERGQVLIWGPDSGEQACGDHGPGRMLEAEALFERAQDFCGDTGKEKPLPLHGVKVVITAGPTREAIDPVRYISNHSSGKMGYALAEAAARAGADVILVSGPVSLACPEGVSRVMVSSALEMLEAANQSIASECDIFIAAAAVADYRPEVVSDQKMKKQGDEGLVIRMTQNPDIVATVANSGRARLVVGFAAETQDVTAYAEKKLRTKGLDLIVANDVSNNAIGFNSDENAVTLITPHGQVEFVQQSKRLLAAKLIEAMYSELKQKNKAKKA
ncbi:MAG: bifunctional phosphopantothenoylcysteine decarboxylase/phosphopantothenate--cysteine ligase CoaBC [Hahellaceae bacterium]|nr:bifunctional phosphopantothenoylcysteine decarboxylase/phosphopantothenate--cysteine ligase CoaBC [Hahellaceae bacterium]MCP5170475.1 bifunctional phosphopantothenoylcysteine decarboxylase/phosphopantothenate--cysteine ligase CoaBC [Hahellaceae bacterium]